MPRPLSEYDFRDWCRLRPLTHGLKTLRYRATDAAHSRRRARAGDALATAQGMRDRAVLVTIAFHDAEAVTWQAKLIRLYVPKALHVMADNSSDDMAAS